MILSFLQNKAKSDRYRKGIEYCSLPPPQLISKTLRRYEKEKEKTDLVIGNCYNITDYDKELEKYIENNKNYQKQLNNININNKKKKNKDSNDEVLRLPYVFEISQGNLGSLLLEFLYLYGCSFNYYCVGISTSSNISSYYNRINKKINDLKENLDNSK